MEILEKRQEHNSAVVIVDFVQAIVQWGLIFTIKVYD